MFKAKKKFHGYEEKSDNFVLKSWETLNSNEHL